MNVVLLGPQGSGKGTQAQLLAGNKGLVHLEMGRIMRSIASSDNQYAPVVRKTINSGNLVPDEYTRLIAWDFINKNDPKTTGFIFEGYPRSLAQYEHLKDILAKFGRKIDAVINLKISENETVRRLSARRTCLKCGQVYNLITSPPPSEGRCKCGGDLVQREDDKPKAIKRRLSIYKEQTHPVFERASKEGIGIEVDGERPINTIQEEIIKKLGNLNA